MDIYIYSALSLSAALEPLRLLSEFSLDDSSRPDVLLRSPYSFGKRVIFDVAGIDGSSRRVHDNRLRPLMRLAQKTKRRRLSSIAVSIKKEQSLRPIATATRQLFVGY